MANFRFSLDDMLDPQKMMLNVTDQIHRDSPAEAGVNLQTSRHKSGAVNPLNVTMFNLAELLMRVPAFDSPVNVLQRFEEIVTGSFGSIYDSVKDVPGVNLLLPKDTQAVLNSLSPDSTGKEPDSSAPETAGATVMDNGTPAPADASGISAEVKAIIQYVKDSAAPYRITSTWRGRGTNSYHDKPGTNGNSLAADIAGPKSGVDTQEMLDIFNALYKVRSQLDQLIYSHPKALGINILKGQHHRYRASTVADHHDHVHVGVPLGTFLRWPSAPSTNATSTAQ